MKKKIRFCYPLIFSNLIFFFLIFCFQLPTFRDTSFSSINYPQKSCQKKVRGTWYFFFLAPQAKTICFDAVANFLGETMSSNNKQSSTGIFFSTLSGWTKHIDKSNLPKFCVKKMAIFFCRRGSKMFAA